jgi:hypothetical protein
MNQDNYEWWMKETLIPNLPPQRVIVLDTAPYHNMKLNKVQNLNTTKTQMKEWLQQETIPFGNNMLKPTLYALINDFKPNSKYNILSIRSWKSVGALHYVYHNIMQNSIPPNVYGLQQRRVAPKNISCKTDDVRWLCEEKFHSMIREDW